MLKITIVLEIFILFKGKYTEAFQAHNNWKQV